MTSSINQALTWPRDRKKHRRPRRFQKTGNLKARGTGKKTGSFRTYPRVPLERALLVALAIKEKNGGNPWPAEQVAAAVGLSSKTPNFFYLLAASQKFGLTTGIKIDGEVALTPLGREVVYGGTPMRNWQRNAKLLLQLTSSRRFCATTTVTDFLKCSTSATPSMASSNSPSNFTKSSP